MTRTRPPVEQYSAAMPAALPPSVQAIGDAKRAADEEDARDKAYTAVVKQYSPLLQVVARGWMDTVQDAEDLVQDAWARVWIYDVVTGRGAGEAGTRKYLLKVLKSCKADTVTKFRRTRETIARYTAAFVGRASDTEEAANHTNSREIDSLMHRALKKLPTCCREAYVLVRQVGMSYADAGEVLEVSAGTIAAQVKIAQRLVVEYFRSAGYDLPRRGKKREQEQEDTP